MGPAEYTRFAYDTRVSRRSRAGALALSLAIVLGIIWALIRVGAFPGVNGRAEQSPLMLFNPSTESRTASAAPRAVTRTRQQTRKQPERTTPPPPKTPTPPPEITINLPGFIHLTREDYARSDVGKMPKQPADAAAASGSDMAGIDSGDTPSVAGAAPGGEPLYAAEWYREPTRAQTQPYMPAGVSEGWGMVACRTIDRYHVEDCQELGESRGSGIARGLRQAAFQFLVRPPRKGGKPLIGAWVRIRFDIVRGTTK